MKRKPLTLWIILFRYSDGTEDVHMACTSRAEARRLAARQPWEREHLRIRQVREVPR